MNFHTSWPREMIAELENRDFKIQRRGRQRERKKKKGIGFINKTTTLHVHYAVLYISLPVFA